MSFGPCADHNPAYGRSARKKGERCDTCRRIKNEGTVAHKLVTNALKQGYLITVYDGEANTLIKSSDKSAILEALFTTDEDRLMLSKPGAVSGSSGWIWLIYGNGNDGWDVITDWTTNLDDVVKPVVAWMEEQGH